jgi:hypothetical protein
MTPRSLERAPSELHGVTTQITVLFSNNDDDDDDDNNLEVCLAARAL